MSKKSKSKMIMNEIKNMYVGLIKMYGNFLIFKNFKIFWRYVYNLFKSIVFFSNLKK